jgi:hypothetical protein
MTVWSIELSDAADAAVITIGLTGADDRLLPEANLMVRLCAVQPQPSSARTHRALTR